MQHLDPFLASHGMALGVLWCAAPLSPRGRKFSWDKRTLRFRGCVKSRKKKAAYKFMISYCGALRRLFSRQQQKLKSSRLTDVYMVNHRSSIKMCLH